MVSSILFVFVLIVSSQISRASDACWDHERNPYNKKTYSERDWTDHILLWDEMRPPKASLWSLFWAHQTYKAELETANTLQNDKRKHCYIGCRITQDTSLDVSVYVGWLKESEDLEDCDEGTAFEPLDYQSTVEGAEKGVEFSSPEKCYDFCKTYKAPKKRMELEI